VSGPGDDKEADRPLEVTEEAEVPPTPSTVGEPAVPTPPQASDVTPEPAPPTSSEPSERPCPWWARKPRAKADEPWSHLVRAMGYEVMVVLVTAAAVAVLAFVVLQGRFQDFYIKLRPMAEVSGEVTLLTIGRESLYLWNPENREPEVTPRALTAELVRFLDAAGASVIVLDFLLDTPAEGDDLLAAAARSHGAVLAAERLEVTDPASGQEFVAGLSPTLVEDLHAGFANFQEEQHTLFSQELLVRSVPLVRVVNRSHLSGPWPANLVGGRQDIDQVVPALSLAAAWLHRAEPEAGPAALQQVLQEGCSAPPLACGIGADDLGLHPLPHPLEQPLAINFRGPEHADGIPTIPASRVLRVMAQVSLMQRLGAEAAVTVPEDLKAILEDRVVVVGRVDASARDRFLTPYSLPIPVTPDMPGPRIHAHIIDTLLSGRHIRPVGGV